MLRQGQFDGRSLAVRTWKDNVMIRCCIVILFMLLSEFCVTAKCVETLEGDCIQYELFFGDKCKVYLAESSIPNSGLGMYTAVDIREGESIGGPDIGINVVDRQGKSILTDYFWNSQNKIEGSRSSTLYPGCGMVANSHLGLVNIYHPSYKACAEDDGGLHRRDFPGSGAISWHYSVHTFARENILAGSELFENYGEHYFRAREKSIGIVPFQANYLQVDKIVKRTKKFLDENNLGLERDLKDGLLGLLIKTTDDPRTRAALPNTIDDLDRISDIGSAKHSLVTPTRSISWLEKYGMCMDNLREGPSTNEQAGRGAFATRFIRKGSLVAPAPLAHVSKVALARYGKIRDENTTAIISSNSTIIGHQLLLNYCFGHRNSSVRFFPYSSVVQFINHRSVKPNLKIRWSTSKFHKGSWLLDSAGELLRQPHAGLIMEFVATQNIAAGEEVFFDYGGDWAKAWKMHVKKWNPVEESLKYVPAYVINKQDLPMRTIFEQKQKPYPKNVEVMCYYQFREDQRKHDIDRSFKTKDISSLDLEAIADSAFPWSRSYDMLRRDSGFYPCKILSRMILDGEVLYMALVSKGANLQARFVSHIQREGIKLVDRRYTTDINLHNTFRHYIAIPDEIFPESWMDYPDE